MKRETCLIRSLLILSMISPLGQAAAVAVNVYGPIAGAEVFCPPEIGQSQDANDNPKITLHASALSTCSNGTRSLATLDLWLGPTLRSSVDLTAESYGGSRAGNPALDAPGRWEPYFHDVPPMVTPVRSYSKAALSVSSNLPYGAAISPWDFQLHWYGSDAGTALRFWVYYVAPDSAINYLNITHTGPIDLHQTISLMVRNHSDINLWGAAVVATSTPEPGTGLLAGAVLVIAACFRPWTDRLRKTFGRRAEHSLP